MLVDWGLVRAENFKLLTVEEQVVEDFVLAKKVIEN